MPKTLLASQGFTRRNFIKGAAALTAMGALAGCSPEEEEAPEEEVAQDAEGAEGEPQESPDQIFAGVCRGNCGGGCYLNVHVRDGQVVRTSARDLPDTAYNRICSRGATHVGRIYGANRLLYPMRRTGERGSGEFEKITWDEAITEIAEKWTAITDEYGPNSMCMMNGTGNYALSSGSSGFVTGTLANIAGMSTISYNVDAAAGLGAQHIGTTQGGLENELTDRINSKAIVVWGCSPTVSLPQMMHFLLEARDNGTRYIVIDPVYNANASKADWWIPVKAGTDGALALSVLNVLFNEQMVDPERLKGMSNAPFLIKEDGRFLRMSDIGVKPTSDAEREPDGLMRAYGLFNVPLGGDPNDPEVVWDADKNEPVPYTDCTNPALEGVTEVEGIAVHTVYEDVLQSISEYPPETASAITGVTEEDIRELARVYAEDGPVATEAMNGLNHYRNGHYTSWALYAIAVVTDNVGKPGAGVGMPEEYLTQFNGTNWGVTAPADSAGNPCQGGGPTMNVNEVRTVQETGEYLGAPLNPKGVYITSGNPMCTMTDQNYTKEWINNMDLVVVADMCMTDTVKYADYVLPAAHWFEQDDVAYLFFSHPYLLWNEKAIEPLGEAKPDYEILQSLAAALGYEDFWNQSADEWMRSALDTEVWKALDIDYDRIKEEGVVRTHLEDNYIADASTFDTPTGRFYLYQEDVFQAYDFGQEVDPEKERHLYWEECVFIGENSDYRKEYPYQMYSEHMRTHTHSQWSDCGYVKDYEPEPMVRLNPEDAEEIGVEEGDTVRCYNTFGEVTLKVTISAGVPRKMASSGRSWNQEDFIDGHFASLPSSEFNQCAANQCYNDCAVKIEKA